MFQGEAHCRTCGAGATDKALEQCSRCKSIFYCSRDCQVKDWSDHKKQCRRLAAESAASPLAYDPLCPHASYAIDEDKESRDRKERLRLGTSCGDPLRENRAALEINRQGLEAKRAGRVEESVKLYSRAIELHGLDHNYFHNRCAAYKLLDKWDMVLIDARRTLELDNSFPLGWCNLLMGCFYTLDLDGARKAADLAPQFADKNHEHYHFVLEQTEWLEEQLSNPHGYPFFVRPICREGDSLAFVYTDGLRLRGQQELLVVDVPTSSINLVQKKIIGGLVSTGQIKPGKKLSLGNIVKVRGYKVVAIPVEDEDQVKILKWELMGQKVPGRNMGPDEELNPGGVVLLKIFKSKKKVSAVTKAQAKLYIDTVVANAHACAKRYKKKNNLRLVEDDQTHVGLA